MKECLITNDSTCCFYTRDKELNYNNISLMGEMIGEVSHDFNNVLTTILGFSQIIMNNNKLDESLKEYMEIIYEVALDGQSIVDKIQNFNRGRNNKDKEYININEVVETVVKMASVKWESLEEDNEIKFNIIKSLKSENNINCNLRELREVILNIMLNAVDSMDNGGDLSIRTYDKDDKVIIEIEDTGIGMDEETVGNIFDPFFSTKKLRGNGVGLSISKKIIEDHGGLIEVESEVGKGSLFRVHLNNLEEVK